MRVFVRVWDGGGGGEAGQKKVLLPARDTVIRAIMAGGILALAALKLGAAAAVGRPYDASTHALVECAPDLPAADAALAPLVTRELLDGVRYHGGGAETHSLVMRSASGTIREVIGRHQLQKVTEVP